MDRKQRQDRGRESSSGRDPVEPWEGHSHFLFVCPSPFSFPNFCELGQLGPRRLMQS